MTKRISQVVTLGSATGKYGGPYDTTLAQANLSAQSGYTVKIVVGHLRHDRPVTENLHAGVAFHTRRVSGPWRLAGPVGLCSFAMVRLLRRSIRASDIVHISFCRELIPIIATIMALATRKKVILQPHGMLTVGRGRARALDPMLRRLMRRADGVIALTCTEGDALRLWLGRDTPEIAIIGNPVLECAGPPMVDEKSADERLPEILLLGRIAPRKNVAHFLAAAELASSNAWPERYVVVGPDGGQLNALRHLMDTLPNVVYEGAIPGSRVADRISRAAVLALTSADEPWGNALATAVSLGIPVLAPNSAALAQTIAHHGAGLIYRDGDINALTTSLHRLVHDDDLRTQCVTQGRKLTQAMFSTVSVAGLLCQLYEGPEPVDQPHEVLA